MIQKNVTDLVNDLEDAKAHFSTNYKGRRFFFSSDRITSLELEPVDEPVLESDDLTELPIESEAPRKRVAVELLYPAVWEGVDLELSGSQDGLKMNWVLDGPNRVSSIQLHWAGAGSL